MGDEFWDKRYRPEITPRWSLRCSLNIHRFESYCMDPAKFECVRCGKRKAYDIWPVTPE